MAHGPVDPELARFLRDELGVDGPAGGSWQFTGPLWLWRGKGKDGEPTKMAWHFITIDGDVADVIRAASPGRTAAWGSVYVHVAIGATRWRTSVFPSNKVSGYLLPVKCSVRKSERLADGDVVTVSLTL